MKRGGTLVARLQLALGVYLFGALGVFLTVAPWTPVWDAATFVLGDSAAAGMLRSGWARGLVTGLGAVNLMVAVADAASLVRAFRDTPPAEGDGS